MVGAGGARVKAAVAARALAAWAVLTLAFWQFGPTYSRAWCDVFGWLVTVGQEQFGPVAVRLAPVDGQPAFEIVAQAAPALVARYPVMPVGTEWTAGTLQAYAHLHAVLVLAVLLAWPVAARGTRLLLLAAAVPAIVASTLLDLPFALYGLLMTGVYETLDPAGLARDPAVLYFDFLQRGGRLLLPLVAAALALIAVGPRAARKA